MLEKTFEEVNYLYHIEMNVFTADEKYGFRFTSLFFHYLNYFQKGGFGDTGEMQRTTLSCKSKTTLTYILIFNNLDHIYFTKHL